RDRVSPASRAASRATPRARRRCRARRAAPPPAWRASAPNRWFRWYAAQRTAHSSTLLGAYDVFERHPGALGESRNQGGPIGRLLAANSVNLTNQREALVEGDVAGRDLRQRSQVRVAKRGEPPYSVLGQGAIPQAAPLELRQKVSDIVRRVGVAEHVQFEEHEALAGPHELPPGHIAVHRCRIGGIE